MFYILLLDIDLMDFIIFSSLGDGRMTPALNAALNQAMNPASKNAVPSLAYSPVSMHLLRGCFHHLIQRQGAPHSALASSDYHPRRKKIDKFVRSMSRERERERERDALR